MKCAPMVEAIAVAATVSARMITTRRAAGAQSAPPGLGRVKGAVWPLGAGAELVAGGAWIGQRGRTSPEPSASTRPLVSSERASAEARF